jgi:hypothetical protein
MMNGILSFGVTHPRNGDLNALQTQHPLKMDMLQQF